VINIHGQNLTVLVISELVILFSISAKFKLIKYVLNTTEIIIVKYLLKCQLRVFYFQLNYFFLRGYWATKKRTHPVDGLQAAVV